MISFDCRSFNNAENYYGEAKLIKYNKAVVEKYTTCGELTILYSVWHIFYMSVNLYRHLLFKQLRDNYSLELLDKIDFWNSTVAYLGYFTGNVNMNGASKRWYFFIVVFVVLMIIYGARYAIAAHLAANVSAGVCLWIFMSVCGLFPYIKLGLVNYFLNLVTSLLYSSFALAISTVLYLPLLIYRRIRSSANL